ncbi:cytochrome P450 [Suillus subalutaceus]|uniref:cytochrome P450 n=1 Tax=Suillus subalutaceus TaxID=48586 RepID=UPI001B87CD07|nr:cytochrome P450 [Suillus subalutaceus]KAG1854439.1 cytochrome P450 [Suillus subalutaceus]
MEKQGGSGGQVIGLMHAGDKFRRMRRSAEAYQPLQMSHAKHMVLDMLSSAATIMKITYGKTTPTSATDPEVREIHYLFESFRTALRPGACLVESIPWLKYLRSYGQDLKQQFERTRELYTNQLNRVKQQMSHVDVGPSFAKYMLEHDNLYNLTETEKAFLRADIKCQTAVAICTLLMAVACSPEEQAKVQAELDTFYRFNGFFATAPTFADQQSLPRLEAFISEALRWRSLMVGFAHRTTQDMIWENYCISAGTTVFGNHWPISRDPQIYPDPDAFKPERWISDQVRIRDDLKFFVYGFDLLLIIWAFQLTLDPTKPLNDWGFMTGAMPNDRPCAIDFKRRFPEVELRHMMQNYPDAA